MDSNGNLYGTAVSEGTSGDGTVFELAKVGSTYSSTITSLASFNGVNGEVPAGQLFMDSGGNLYGTTEFGGASDDGTIFELAKGSSTITALASFNGADGAYPAGPGRARARALALPQIRTCPIKAYGSSTGGLAARPSKPPQRPAEHLGRYPARLR